MERIDAKPRKELFEIRSLLQAVIGRILQNSDWKTGVAAGAATNVVVGSAFTTTVSAAIGSIGTAGTGAAIAGLSGAAKMSATLAWIGGLVGGGVAAGSFVLVAGGVGAGIYGSRRIRRTLLGHSRRDEELSEDELRILEATTVIVSVIDHALAGEAEIDRREIRVLSRIAITPLLEAIASAISANIFSDLSTYNRARLRGHVNNLNYLTRKIGNNADPA